jgi:alkaline phosphatase D
MRTYSAMLRSRPDFFIHSAIIYADCVIRPEVKLPNGQLWKNLVTEEKARVAQTLADFRGNYKYNLLDANVRAFNAEVPMLAQWDDHEVTNDWCPGQALAWSEYSDKSILKLAARGCRAFHEFMPMRETPAEAGRIYRKVAYGPLLDVFLLDMRSYRTAVVEDGSAAAILGPVQLAWLKRELMNSQATWKIIAADLPIGVVSSDAVAMGDGPARGRELEIADLLAFIKHGGIRNTVWHRRHALYRRALLRSERRGVPGLRAVLGVHLGPLHAGSWQPQKLDTRSVRAQYSRRGCSAGQPDDLAPCFGLQFFGHVAIDGATEVMTVTLKDIDDHDLWSTRIEPRLEKWSRGTRRCGVEQGECHPAVMMSE